LQKYSITVEAATHTYQVKISQGLDDNPAPFTEGFLVAFCKRQIHFFFGVLPQEIQGP
jgi:hypothetical protein